MRAPQAVYYWDASGALSALIDDEFTTKARSFFGRRHDIHLLSTLAVAEVLAVLSRLYREQRLSREAFDEAERSIREGPWRMTRVQPQGERLAALSRRHALRGADLWHLATALKHAAELPEIRLVTFDLRLAKAAAIEGLA